jgi:hypothetical protein
VPELGGRLGDAAVQASSRRGFLARVGETLLGLTAASAVSAAVKPGDAEAYHFCGHTYTTGSCPHPTGLPRIDSHGYPLRARDGRPVDDLGRLIDGHGRPITEAGHHLHDPDGRVLPSAPRTRICRAAGQRAGASTHIDGAWYRCCGGRVRKLSDCCAYTDTRINGDGALTGYCYSGRKVYCTQFYDTSIPC